MLDPFLFQMLIIAKGLIVKMGAHVWIKLMVLSADAQLDFKENIARRVRTSSGVIQF